MFQFNARNVNPEQTPAPVPKARYKLMVTKSNMKANKSNDGGFIHLTLQIIEGQYQGRVVNNNYNIWNKNQQAVEIAHKQLSALCHALNVFDLQGQDGADDNYLPMLHNIPFEGDITVDGEYNRLAKVYDVNGNAPGEMPSGPPQPAQAQPQPPAAPPQQPGYGQPAQGGWAPQPGAPAQQGGWTPPGQPEQAAPPQQGGWGAQPGAAPAPAQPAAPPQQGGWGAQPGAPAQPPGPPQGQPGGWTPPGAAPAQPAAPPPGNPWGR